MVRIILKNLTVLQGRQDIAHFDRFRMHLLMGMQCKSDAVIMSMRANMLYDLFWIIRSWAVGHWHSIRPRLVVGYVQNLRHPIVYCRS